MKGSLRGNKSDWRRLGKILGVSKAGRESMEGDSVLEERVLGGTVRE